MSNFRDFLAARKKAIVGLLAPVVVIVATALGLDVDISGAQLAVTAILTALITGVGVHQVKNDPEVPSV